MLTLIRLLPWGDHADTICFYGVAVAAHFGANFPRTIFLFIFLSAVFAIANTFYKIGHVVEHDRIYCAGPGVGVVKLLLLLVNNSLYMSCK